MSIGGLRSDVKKDEIKTNLLGFGARETRLVLLLADDDKGTAVFVGRVNCVGHLFDLLRIT